MTRRSLLSSVLFAGLLSLSVSGCKKLYLKRTFGSESLSAASKGGDFDLHRVFGDAPKWMLSANSVRAREKSVTGKVDSLESLKKLKFIGVITTTRVTEPTLAGDKFAGGTFEGAIHVFDVETAENLGGAAFVAASSVKVDYSFYLKDTPKDEADSKDFAVKRDFSDNIIKAARVALGAKEKPKEKP